MQKRNKGLAAHYRRGMEGEDAAADYLCDNGYVILSRNYRYRRAEIDIIALKSGILVIVEVKTRTRGFYEALSHTISPLKIRRLVKAADHYVRNRGLDVEVRFDIIQIEGVRGRFDLKHTPNAFYGF